MNNTDNEFMGSPKYPAIKFPELDASYKGRLIEISKRQAYDPDTEEPMTWKNGDPMYVFIWKVVNEAGEIANIWVKGHLFSALREACEKAGVTSNTDLVGALVQVKHHAVGEKKKPTHSPPKLFQAKVTLMEPAERAKFAASHSRPTDEPNDMTAANDEHDPFGDE
jgi:hypothetical protein